MRSIHIHRISRIAYAVFFCRKALRLLFSLRLCNIDTNFRNTDKSTATLIGL